MQKGLTKRLGQIVLFHRKKAGLTREKLCEFAGVSRGVLIAIEKGNGNPKLSSLFAIFGVLNIRMEFVSPLMEAFDAQG
ncbi:MAG: helix-turn-helix transcriptional regulator [Pseudodesulfovibrio sp.]|nr:helix-turn-helix transcriptional regulator [Pseudodesulfovibrio sp.]